MNRVRIAIVAVALVGVAVGLFAVLGDEPKTVPPGGAALVDDKVIPISDFLRAYKIVSAASSMTSAVIPDPPRFLKCAKSRTKPGGFSLGVSVALCRTDFRLARPTIMEKLILDEWYVQVAKSRGYTPPEREVKRQLATAQKFQFGKNNFKQVLKKSGLSRSAVDAELRRTVTATLARDFLVRGDRLAANQVTPAEVRAYYEKNKVKSYSVPEKRNVLMILHDSKAQMDKMIAAIKGGQSWSKVVTKYGAEFQPADAEPLYEDAALGSLPPQIGPAIFKAKVGDYVGPAKSQLGYYFAKVLKITPVKYTPFDKKLAAGIRAKMVAEDIARRGLKIRTEMREKTICAFDYRTQFCKGVTADDVSEVRSSNFQ